MEHADGPLDKTLLLLFKIATIQIFLYASYRIYCEQEYFNKIWQDRSKYWQKLTFTRILYYTLGKSRPVQMTCVSCKAEESLFKSGVDIWEHQNVKGHGKDHDNDIFEDCVFVDEKNNFYDEIDKKTLDELKDLCKKADDSLFGRGHGNMDFTCIVPVRKGGSVKIVSERTKSTSKKRRKSKKKEKRKKSDKKCDKTRSMQSTLV